MPTTKKRFTKKGFKPYEEKLTLQDIINNTEENKTDQNSIYKELICFIFITLNVNLLCFMFVSSSLKINIAITLFIILFPTKHTITYLKKYTKKLYSFAKQFAKSRFAKYFENRCYSVLICPKCKKRHYFYYH
jgi:hypothetical protein